MTAGVAGPSIASMFNPSPKGHPMRPWIKRTLIAMFGATLLAGGVAACAHREHGPRFSQLSPEDAAKWRVKLIERAGSKLDLDDAQKQRLGVLFDKLNEQRSALVGNAADPRAAMAQLVAGPTFDRARASALVAEKTEAVRLKSPDVITAAADFYDSLKPEQQAKVREMMARGHGRHGWRS